MIKFGLWTREQYLKLGESRKFSGAHVAYNLLRVSDHPTLDEVKSFEDISITLRMGNGTFRTTFRNRFDDVNAALLPILSRIFPPSTQLLVEDRAVSHGLTSFEWAQSLLGAFPTIRLQASDLLLYIWEYRTPGGEVYILEPDGAPLQYVKPPFVVSLAHREPRRYPVNQMVAKLALRRFHRLGLPAGPPEAWPTGSFPGSLTKIPFIHPEAAAFSADNSALSFAVQSVFVNRPASSHLIRTMNILNTSYFTRAQLQEGIGAIFSSLWPGGIWVVGRTLEEDLTNHVTFFERGPSSWNKLGSIGSGSDIEDLILNSPLPHV